MKTKVVFYGGVGEIGGNKILVEEGDTRVFMDFGKSFAARRSYFSDPFIAPKRLEDLITLGVIPDLKGLYVNSEECLFDCVLLSHAHSDHSGYISLLNRGVRVYCGEATKRILDVYRVTGRRTLETDLSGLEITSFKTGDVLSVGSLEVRPVHVDHSTPGSYGFIVRGSKTVVYTGDFRVHGTRPDLTEDFVREASEESVDLLLVEGTNIFDVEISSEEEVCRKLLTCVEKCRRLVVAYFSLTDVDRLKSFIRVAEDTGRSLVITPKHAKVLEGLQELKIDIPPLTSGKFKVYRRRKSREEKWEKEVFEKYEAFDSSEVSKRQEEVILVLPTVMIRELLEIKPREGSIYVLSSSEPFTEEQEIEFERLINWVKRFRMPMYRVHCSGHASPHDIVEVVKRIKPREVGVVHSEHPEVLASLISSNCSCKVFVPVRGEIRSLN